jgi:uncharacterized protein YgiM (DUF1202 family)
MNHRTKALSLTCLILLLALLTTLGSAALAAETEQRSQFSAPIMVVNTSFLNVRTGPGVQYSVLVTVVGGTELPVLGVARDLVWYQVSTLAGVGWVNSQYVLPRGDFTHIPFVEAPPLVPFGFFVPGTAAPVSDDAIGAVGTGAGGWGVSVKITHPSRTQPTMNSSSLGDAVEDRTVIFNLIESAVGDNVVWYRADIPYLGVVWIEGSKSRLRPHACGNISAVTLVEDVRPTIGPDGSGTLTGNVLYPDAEEGYLLDHQAGQFKVEFSDGGVGWIPQTAAAVRRDVHSFVCQAGGVVPGVHVAPSAPAAPGVPAQPAFARASVPHVVINTAFLNLRSGPGAQFSVVTTLPGGAEVPVVGVAPDGVWYLVAGTFGEAWLNNQFVLFRGDGRNLPVIRFAPETATLARPVATITNAVALYVAPSLGSTVIGAISGPVEVPVVARTADSSWVQINTVLGFGWARASEVTVRGDLALIPVVAN